MLNTYSHRAYEFNRIQLFFKYTCLLACVRVTVRVEKVLAKKAGV